MSFLVDSAMVSGLPINGRRFADLALLSRDHAGMNETS
jgi:hypothetical protein